MKNENKKIFFDVEEIIKQDFLVNMIYGARGIGKTYSSLKYVKKNYDNTGMGAIYLRRYKTEFQDFNEIFNTLILNNDIKGDEIEYKNKGRKFVDTKNNKIILKGIPLSQGIIKKSQDFSNINLIIFDEFILDNGNYQYIPNEFASFNNFIETISRLRELTQGTVVKIIMLANSGSRNNPYFINYNIPIFKGQYYKKNDLLVYKPEQKKFKDLKKQTRWGQFILNNTNMEEYMLEGNFKDKKDYIVNLPAKTSYIATIIYLDNKMGIYKDISTNDLIISKKYNEQFKTIYALTKNDRTPDYKLLDKKNNFMKYLIKYNEYGKIKFDDMKIQTIFFEILKLL